jgi:hypothetical protein
MRGRCSFPTASILSGAMGAGQGHSGLTSADLHREPPPTALRRLDLTGGDALAFVRPMLIEGFSADSGWSTQ